MGKKKKNQEVRLLLSQFSEIFGAFCWRPPEFGTGLKLLCMLLHIQWHSQNTAGRSHASAKLNPKARSSAEAHRQDSTTALEDPSPCEGTKLKVLQLKHIFKRGLFFSNMQSECTSHFLSYPFFLFWQLLKRLLGKGTTCCLSKPSFTTKFLYPSASLYGYLSL